MLYLIINLNYINNPKTKLYIHLYNIFICLQVIEVMRTFFIKLYYYFYKVIQGFKNNFKIKIHILYLP